MKPIFMKAARPAQRCLLALLLALPVAAGAQNDDIPTREVSVGMGFGTSNLGWDLSRKDVYGMDSGHDMPLGTYRSLRIYDDGSVQPPCFAIGYRRDFKAGCWLAYGVTASYECKENKWKERVSDRTVASSRDSYCTLMPALRLYYLRHRSFRMYGEVGVGASLRYVRQEGEASGSRSVHFTGHFTGFGMQVGRQLFFGTELGYGSLGVARMTAGYRF